MRLHVVVGLSAQLAAAGFGAPPVAAQPGERPAVRSDTVPEPEPKERRLHLYPIAGLHFGGPVRASVAGGVGWTSLAPGEPVRAFLLVEPGLRGGRASLVTGSSVGSFGSAWTIRGSYLQLWGGAPHRKYGGVELQIIPILGIGGRIGAFRPFGTPKGDRKVLIIGDVSLLI